MKQAINRINRSYTAIDEVLSTYEDFRTVRFVPDQELLDAFAGVGFDYCYAGDMPFNGEPSGKYNEYCEELTHDFGLFG